jgi:hypothetical protein
MRSLKGCWDFLQKATGNHVIIALGAGAYDILPLGPNSPGEQFVDGNPARVVGVYSPDAAWAAVTEDAEALAKAHGVPRK